MSVTTYTSKARIETVIDHNINCPKCDSSMAVKEYYKYKKFGKGVHWLTQCTCLNGCLNIDPEPGEQKEYFFVASSVEEAYVVAERIKNKAGSV